MKAGYPWYNILNIVSLFCRRYHKIQTSPDVHFITIDPFLCFCRRSGWKQGIHGIIYQILSVCFVGDITRFRPPQKYILLQLTFSCVFVGDQCKSESLSFFTFSISISISPLPPEDIYEISLHFLHLFTIGTFCLIKLLIHNHSKIWMSFYYQWSIEM